jgi:hypothetical protein
VRLPGLDVVLGALVGTALLTADGQQAAVGLQPLGLFAVRPLAGTPPVEPGIVPPIVRTPSIASCCAGTWSGLC